MKNIKNNRIYVVVSFENKDKFKSAMKGQAKFDGVSKSWYVELSSDNEVLVDSYLNASNISNEKTQKNIQKISKLISFDKLVELVETMRHAGVSNSSDNNYIYKSAQSELSEFLDELREYDLTIDALVAYEETKFYRAGNLNKLSIDEIANLTNRF